jgi:hypothetical protein
MSVPSGSMSCMSVLTRDEAQTRARLLDVHRYTIELDLTTGEDTFDSRTVIAFTVRGDQAGTDTFVELKPAELRSVTLDGHPLDPEPRREPAPAARPHRGRARTARRREHALLPHRRGHAPLHRPHRRRDLPLHPALHGGRPARLRRLRPARPQGRLRPDRHGPRRLDRPRQRHHRTPRRRPLAGRPHPPHLDLPRRRRRRPLALGAHRTPRPALRHPLPPLPGPPPRRGRRRDPRHHPPVLRPLPREVRGALPLRLLRPGLRPRVQRGRHGEPRPGHLPRRVHLPLRRHRHRAADPRHGHRPRDGPHVVRRPRHPPVVGRHLAERVLRRVHGLPDPHRGHPLHRHLDRLRSRPQGLGLRRRPAPLHPPRGPGERRRHRLRPPQLRRHLVRQGRFRATAVGGLARREGLPRRHQHPLRPPQVRQRHPRRLHRLPRLRHRTRRPRLGRRVAAHDGRGHPHARSPGRGRMVAPRHPHQGSHGVWFKRARDGLTHLNTLDRPAAPARTASPSASTTTTSTTRAA